MNVEDKGLFYEIEYDACPIQGVGKYVLKPQPIAPQEKDEIRERFYAMRDLSRNYHSYNPFYDRRSQQDNAVIFYKQGIFMQEFADVYKGNVPFSSYFPNYQMMGYEQLRTYFTWRTQVRNGMVADTALSYAFVYIYELLNNIGVENPQDGLDRLMFFWKSFRGYNEAIDKYVLIWLKDYHIYYGLPQAFSAFAEENNILQHYPKMADTDNPFDLFCAIAKYDIRKSVFFTADNSKLITDCFSFVLERLEQAFSVIGMRFNRVIFAPTKKMTIWQPFHSALFYNWKKQPDRRVVLSPNEIYICKQSKWEFSTVITTEEGRRLVGYVLKQMEADLRRLTNYKFKLSADLHAVTHMCLIKLNQSGQALDKIISTAVQDFYKETTKIVVSVDDSALHKIRQEALSTQEKLIVEPEADTAAAIAPAPVELPFSADPWDSFKDMLETREEQALLVILHEQDQEQALKQFADDNGIMLEVLVDGINEKAMDALNDNIIDEDFRAYDDYREKLKEVFDYD